MLILNLHRVLFALSIGLASGLVAAATDPTKPPIVEQAAEEQDNKSKPVAAVASKPALPKRKVQPPIEKVSNYKLAALVHSDGQQTAYVNNRLHKVGDKLGSYKISVIDTDHIHLKHGGSEWRIDLYQRILKIK